MNHYIIGVSFFCYALSFLEICAIFLHYSSTSYNKKLCWQVSEYINLINDNGIWHCAVFHYVTEHFASLNQICSKVVYAEC